MRILAKKRFLFSCEGKTFVTVPLAVMEMPDAFQQSLMFRLAQMDGDVTVLNEPQAEKTEKPARRSARRRAAEGASHEQ